MALVSDRCICLRKFEYSETSQILTLLSRDHGIVRAMAKGAHRRTKAGASRFDGGADLLEVGQAMFTDDSSRELATLTEWKLTEGHPELRQNLRGLYLALYAVELLEAMFQEHDVHSQLFDRAAAVLGELGTGRREEAFLAFELEMLREAGFSPQLDGCVACGGEIGEREAVFFSAARGGVICRGCESRFPDRMTLDGRLLRLMRSVQGSAGGRLAILTRHQTDPLNRLLAEHVEHVLGRRLRMRQYVVFPGDRSPGGPMNSPVAAGGRQRV